MTYHFDELTLDVRRRELRRRGELVPLQPQLFRLLVYLVEHRDRVVTKEDLLADVWDGVVVGDGAIQRAVSLVRRALGPSDRIRTLARQGYRFVGDVRVDAAAPAALRPLYVRNGDVHIAYGVVGAGPVDVVVIPGWTFPMSAAFEEPCHAALVDDLAALGRVILVDKRGTGLSDRVKAMPTLDQRVDDLRAVLDDLGAAEVILIGISEGGPLSIQFAVTHPDRVRGLALWGAFPRMAVGPGYPWGWNSQEIERLRGYIRRDWGAGATPLAAMASRADDPATRAWAARVEQHGASPGAALDLLEMNLAIDVRPVLGDVRAPTAVLHAADDPVIATAAGRYLAEQIPGATWRELSGCDHLVYVGARGEAVASVAALIAAR